ncbi:MULTISPECIES: DNA-binding protein [unclassified Nocardiopsis]|uniref:DNA-binding protein n=1 Tax=unclassified Nocardiopsis TaxID=2649073 RepID=UPI000A8B156B|nr:DNA-binding protein [Nocardiopsis sp. TSRI0078]
MTGASPYGPDGSGRTGDPVPAEAAAHSVRAASACVVALDTRCGARGVVDTAVRNAARAGRAVLTRFPESSDVLAAAAEAHQVAGWVAFDAERQDLSRRMTLAALRSAGRAGDRSMEYFALGQWAMQDVHLWRPTEARRVCEAALSGGPTGSVRTLFTLRLARAAAQEGERARARRLIGETRSRHLEGPRRGDPDWTWWLTEAEISWHRGMTGADAGEWGRAAECFAETVELLLEQERTATPGRVGGSGRFRFHAVVSLLWSLAAARSWAEAEAVLVREVLPLRATVASVRCERLLAEAVRLLDGARRRPSLRDTARWFSKGERADGVDGSSTGCGRAGGDVPELTTRWRPRPSPRPPRR